MEGDNLFQGLKAHFQNQKIEWHNYQSHDIIKNEELSYHFKRLKIELDFNFILSNKK